MKRDKTKRAENIVSALELPKDLFLGMPVLSMEGNRTLMLTNHRGIVQFGEEEIKVAVQNGSVVILGRALIIPRFSKDMIEISGVIKSVSFLV